MALKEKEIIDLINAQSLQFDTNREEAINKVKEIMNAKPYRFAHFMRRINYQYIKGNSEEKKAFKKWISGKLKGNRQHTPDNRYNPLQEIINILSKDVIDAPEYSVPQVECNDMDITGASGDGSEFFKIYNEKSLYYSRVKSMPASESALKVIEELKNIKYKGIIVYPEAVTWEPIQRVQHFLKHFAEQGYLCLFCSAQSGVSIIQKVQKNLYIVEKEEDLIHYLTGKVTICICTWLMQRAFIDNLSIKYLWYDLVDQLEFFSLYDEKMKEFHQNIVEEADLVTYSADKLYDYVDKAKKSYLIKNAVNIEDFLCEDIRPAREIKDIIDSGKKIIGYFGAIEEWFDMDVIIEFAKKNSDFAVVLIGNNNLKNDLSKYDNIHELGFIDYINLKEYAAFFDICIIPFKVNELTNCVSPLKFFEYAALGKPVISSRIREMKNVSEEWVGTYETLEELEELARKMSCENVKKIAEIEGVKFANKNTWKSRFNVIKKHIEEDINGMRVHSEIRNYGSISAVAATFLDFEGKNFYGGGAERYLIDLNEICEEKDIEFNIYQYGNFPWVRRFENINVISLGIEQNDAKVLSIEAIRKFNEISYRNNIGKTNLNVYSAFFEAYPLAAAPSVGISHGVAWDNPAAKYSSGTEFWLNNKRFIEGAKVCDKMVSVDNNTANWFQTIDYDIGQNMEVILNYVDLQKFKPRADYNKKRDKVVITYARRLYEARGLYIVLDILDDILSKYENVEMHFIGRGFKEDTDHVEKKIKKWGNRVQWYSLLPDEMPDALQKSDIALIPTKYSEGTSLSCLESMATGNAVISTRIGGLTDLVLNEYNGLLIEPNSESLKDALEALLDDTDKLIEIKERALAVSSKFSKKIWKKKWGNLIDKIACENDKEHVQKSQLVEVYTEEFMSHKNFPRFINYLLWKNCLVYIRVNKVEKYLKASYGRVQFISMDEVSIAKPDFVFETSRKKSNSESIIIDDSFLTTEGWKGILEEDYYEKN